MDETDPDVVIISETDPDVVIIPAETDPDVVIIPNIVPPSNAKATLPKSLRKFQNNDMIRCYDSNVTNGRTESISTIFNMYQASLVNIINYLVFFQNTALDGMKLNIKIDASDYNRVTENVTSEANRLTASFVDCAFLAKTAHFRNMFYIAPISASSHIPMPKQVMDVQEQKINQPIPLPKILPRPSTIILANACQLWICPRLIRNHYTLAVINWTERVIYVYDSLYNPSSIAKEKSIVSEDFKYHLYCLSFFRSYSEIMAEKWTVRYIYDKKLHMQMDRHSCGYFVIAFYNGLVDWLTQVLFNNNIDDATTSGVDFMSKYINYDVTESSRRLAIVYKTYEHFVLPTNSHESNVFFEHHKMCCYKSFFSDVNTPRISISNDIDCITFMKQCAVQLRNELGGIIHS